MAPTDAELATQALSEEGNFRFQSFSAADAVTLVSAKFESRIVAHNRRACLCGNGFARLPDM